MAFALKGAGSDSTANSATANQATFVLTTVTTVGAANDLAVLRYAVDNNQTTDGDEVAVTGVADSAGNFWQKGAEFTNGQGTAQTGATCGIWYCNLQNALAIGATVTLTFSNAASRDAVAVGLEYFTKAAGFKAAVEGTPGTLAADAAAAGSLSVTTANIACLRIRAIASESSTATALTKTAAFTAVLTQSLTSTGASATNQGTRGEYLISTGTGTASNPTAGAGSVDHASVYVAFREDAVFKGDPPNDDDFHGSTVAIAARKAVVAALITASAGVFMPPLPRVADPAAAATQTGVPLFAGAAPQLRCVYYQSNFIPPYPTVQAAAAPAKEGWQAPLSGAPAVAKAQVGYSYVPFNTAQLSVNFTNFGWHGQPPLAAPVAQAQVGSSFVPYNTAQLSVNFTPFGWQSQPPTAPPVARAQAGYSFVPYNTAQLSVNFTNFGWYKALSPAPAVAKSWQGNAFVPYNTAQLSVNFTNFGWYEALAGAPNVAKAIQGDSFVPYNTAQLVAVVYSSFYLQPLSGAPPVAKAIQGEAFVPFNTVQFIAATEIGVPLNFGDAAPRLTRVYYQAKFDPPYAPTATTTDATDPVGDYSLIPLYRRKKLQDELFEIELKLRDIAIDIPLPGHSEPVIYDRPLLEPFTNQQQTVKLLVSRRAKIEAEYRKLLKAQQDDDDDSAILLLWP